MEDQNKFSRREFIGGSAAALSASLFSPLLKAAQPSGVTRAASPDFEPDVEIDLVAKADRVQIIDGPKTLVWKFFAELRKGPAETVQPLPDNSYLGPILRLKTGQKVRISFHNRIPQHCIVHWHGLHVPQAMDGHPMYAIESGTSYVYEFKVMNRAGLYWYHSHTHELTAKQVYSGLAGLIMVSDGEEEALNLPSGVYDVPLVFQDRSFTSDNKLQYISHMRERMMGFLGDQILVNGTPDFQLPVVKGVYRFRFLNGSNSRIYKLQWSDHSPFKVIATDGGLLDSAVERPYITLAPAERVEVIVDFRQRSVGSELSLNSAPFPGMRHGPRMQSRLPEGSAFPLMSVKVTEGRSESNFLSLPKKLSKLPDYSVSGAFNRHQPLSIALRMRRMNWWLSGKTFEMLEATPSERVRLGQQYLIQFDNGFRSHGGMRMPHPMHMHGQQFKIVRREVLPGFHSLHDELSEGFVDHGLKDSVLVMPGERVTMVKPFEDFTGLFLYHCHNLEHEDMGMMRNFDVYA